MFTTLASIGKKTARHASSALLFSAILLTGCASGISNVANADPNPALPQTQMRPDDIYVYAFVSSADQVKLDSGGLAHKLMSRLSGSSDEPQQAADALRVQQQVADEIVRKLQAMGLHAVRADAPPPADQNVLLVQGSFEKIDAGNRRRRTVIGLGAGESDVGTAVQVLYKPAGGMPTLVQSFDANADSGKAPGVVETAGVGAVAGHIATSAAVGGGMHAVSETKHDTVGQDAKRLGDKIAKQIADIGVSEGWLPNSTVR
ncbi:DUF4410 domain-containing protein [Paraburkholderia sp. SARCC-3016]|jgi:hypothetical protein|uniref:DUF4410 domain-containing protein n=1 Tax=Paraburkholderia sp. SARCC-3016 TaxID=3058611 RepID=UPI00280A1586|nr:DUF4410 domain-containing protein [Paraburkholderia sp. SARCC-3016]MDQ7976974.1 DUF4410 domain-containing protein [Paraburkholderia sp. SARCC-3016]